MTRSFASRFFLFKILIRKDDWFVPDHRSKTRVVLDTLLFVVASANRVSSIFASSSFPNFLFLSRQLICRNRPWSAEFACFGDSASFREKSRTIAAHQNQKEGWSILAQEKTSFGARKKFYANFFFLFFYLFRCRRRVKLDAEKRLVRNDGFIRDDFGMRDFSDFARQYFAIFRKLRSANIDRLKFS